MIQCTSIFSKFKFKHKCALCNFVTTKKKELEDHYEDFHMNTLKDMFMDNQQNFSKDFPDDIL